MSGLLTKKSILAAKIETTVGTAISLATADTAFNVYDATISPEIEKLARDAQGGFSKLASVVGKMSGKCSFKIDLATPATTAPTWMTTFLPACGLIKQAGLQYIPVSAPPGTSGVKTITIGYYINGLVHILKGCMGNLVITDAAGAPSILEFEFTGVYGGISAASILAQTLPASTTIINRMTGFTYGALAGMVASSAKFDLGNDVQLREDAAVVGGLLSAIVVDRKTRCMITLESDTTNTPLLYSDLITGNRQALQITRSGTNSEFFTTMPKASVEAQPFQDKSGIMAEEITFISTLSAVADDDVTFDYELES